MHYLTTYSVEGSRSHKYYGVRFIVHNIKAL